MNRRQATESRQTLRRALASIIWNSPCRRRSLIMIAVCLLPGTGCRIPKLCCPQPGPELPSDYKFNNGQSYWTAPPDVLPTPPSVQQPSRNDKFNDGEQRSTNEIERRDTYSGQPVRGLTKFVQSVGFQRPAEPIQGDTSRESANSNPILNSDVSVPHQQGVALQVTDPLDVDSPNGTITSSDLDQPGNSSESMIGQLPVSAFYQDEFLSNLINEGLAGNQQLRILAEEIRIANNETYARSGAYLPFVSLGAGAGLEKSGRHTRAGAVEEQLEVANGTKFPDPLGDFMVSTDISWEIDIWHRLRNAQRSAAIRYLATQEGRNFVVTRLVADIAENYYRLLALDAKMQVLETTIAIQQQSLEAVVALKAAARSTELAVQRFRAEVQKNESERTIIRQEIVETENRINFLVGRYPQPVERSQVEFADLNLNVLAAGIPSDLLQNRPDIREAERLVAAAGLDVRVARARFYPSLNLTAGMGWNAFSTGYLFRTPESLIYGIAGGLVGPLINRRAIEAEYSSANANQLQAIYEYQKTILEAHIEVVNHLTKVENLRRSLEVKRRQLDALTQSVNVANNLFQNARAEYIEVLLVQRELQEARQELVATKLEQLTAIVNAYQSLGGGGF